MPPRKVKPRKTALSPEEKAARAYAVKCKFRATVRFVIQNLYWLGDIEDMELGDDVQKNIVVLTRKKGKKGLLSLGDKGILNIPTHLRSDVEKEHLFREIGGFKCFRRYPTQVKKELAGVTYFVYYGPGRTIVRQGDDAQAMYFIITGEVGISQEAFDPVYNRIINHDLGTMGPGDMFGEVSLLHDIPRTATARTNGHVEMLCVKKPDFNRVLKTTVKKQWDEVKNSMREFTYFSEWSEMSIRECCILAKVKDFALEDTILGDGHGLNDYVYFILKGKCKVTEMIYVQTFTSQNKKSYKLYDPTLEEDLYKTEVTVPTKKTKDTSRKPTKKDRSSTELKRGSLESSTEMLTKDMSKSITNVDMPTPIQETEKPREKEYNYILPKNVEVVFMQICTMKEKGTFGIGEYFTNRRVIAIKPTQCLLIPRYWLMQRNNGNVWNKVQQFLSNSLPKTKQVFQEFVINRRWLTYRKSLVDDILAKKMVNNDNVKANIPFFIRLHEDIQFP